MWQMMQRYYKWHTFSDACDLRDLWHKWHLKSYSLWTHLMCWLHFIGFDSCFILCVANMYLLVYNLLHTSHCHVGIIFSGIFGASECFVFWWYFSCCVVLNFLKESLGKIGNEAIIWVWHTITYLRAELTHVINRLCKVCFTMNIQGFWIKISICD